MRWMAAVSVDLASEVPLAVNLEPLERISGELFGPAQAPTELAEMPTVVMILKNGV